MIGAGIFALLGEAGAVAGAAVWMSFLIAGIVAVLIGYVCVKLGIRYPTSGGLITYLIAGFGRGRLTGITAWLGYISAVVIVTAMVAVSFGGYATSLFIGADAGPAWDNFFITAVIVVMVGVNLVGAQFVARAQTADRRRRAGRLLRLHRRDDRRSQPRPARVQRLPHSSRRSSRASRSRSSPTSASTSSRSRWGTCGTRRATSRGRCTRRWASRPSSTC